MFFKDVIGQKPLKATLTKLVNGGRIPHALLLWGPEGCGKMAIALALAQYLLCTNRMESESCGECSNCLKAKKYIHPDLHFAFPTVGSKAISEQFLPQWRSFLANPYQDVNSWLQSIGAENKQGNITKEECVNIVKKLSLKTFEGNYKIMIIWLPEYLGKEGNRLLKIIEEPPEHTLFILVSERQELLLNTILSRTQLVKVPPIQSAAIEAYIRTNSDQSQETIATIVQISDGNLNKARQLMEKFDHNFSEMLLSWLRKCYKGNGIEMMDWVANFAAVGRENQKHFIQYALQFFHEFLKMKMAVNSPPKLLTAEKAAAERMTGLVEFEQIEEIIHLLNDYIYYVERNANPKILFLNCSIWMHKLFRNKANTKELHLFRPKPLYAV